MYIARLTDKLLRDNLETFGAVLVEGPKWCGKSTSAARGKIGIVYCRSNRWISEQATC